MADLKTNARGPSSGSKKAQAYLAKNPGATAAELAKRFDIDQSTVYRAPWWKARNKPTAE